MARPEMIKQIQEIMTPIKFKPSKGTVIVKIVQKGQTEGGIFLPENATENDEAILAACHPDFTEAKVGDKVLIRSNSDCQKIKLGDAAPYLVFKEEAILGVYQ